MHPAANKHKKARAQAGIPVLRRPGPYLRRAGVVVQVAIMSTIIMGFSALAVDLGLLYTSRAELQAAADAAALAAASQLGGSSSQENPEVLARQAAAEYAARHRVFGDPALIDVNTDVEFGRAVYNPATERFEFEPAASNYDAVRVTVRRTQDSPGGPIPLLFANVMGRSEQGLQARAAAVLVPRDIAVVIDISNSMCWDSQLRFWNRTDGGYSNLRDIWCALDGPQPSRPYLPGAETDTEYADDTGPTFGAMTTWGSPLIPDSYRASTDPGLWYIPKGSNCTVAAARTSLLGRGYSTRETDALLSAAKDNSYSNNWRNRVGVILGLAVWHSGMAGGYSPPGGDGDTIIEDFEVQWTNPPAFARNWNWQTFVNWVGSSSMMSTFRYRYGLKSFTHFLLEGYPESFATAGLWATPEEPLRAVKDAVQTMVDVITALDSQDHISLEVFATTARHIVNLTSDLQAIPDALYQLQSGHWDRATCMGGGLDMAIRELTSPRARAASAKVIMLMSDGVPNVDQYGNTLSDGHPSAVGYAYAKAEEAAGRGMRIYCVSVGYSASRTVMQTIASIGHGQEFFAAGNPEEYTEQLREIFRTLGGRRPVVLIE
jgi:Flp pilus assembly protein TadG